MKAMIFAAGLGSRLKPWTDHHPKALALVNGKTLLQRNIEYLQQYDIDEVIVNVHHFAEQIVDVIEKNKGEFMFPFVVLCSISICTMYSVGYNSQHFNTRDRFNDK